MEVCDERGSGDGVGERYVGVCVWRGSAYCSEYTLFQLGKEACSVAYGKYDGNSI